MKSNYKLSMWLGVILLIIPFLGIPQSWKDFTLFVIGMILVAVGLFQRNQEVLDKKDDTEEIFVESDSGINNFSKDYQEERDNHANEEDKTD